MYQAGGHSFEVTAIYEVGGLVCQEMLVYYIRDLFISLEIENANTFLIKAKF